MSNEERITMLERRVMELEKKATQHTVAIDGLRFEIKDGADIEKLAHELSEHVKRSTRGFGVF